MFVWLYRSTTATKSFADSLSDSCLRHEVFARLRWPGLRSVELTVLIQQIDARRLVFCARFCPWLLVSTQHTAAPVAFDSVVAESLRDAKGPSDASPQKFDRHMNIYTLHKPAVYGGERAGASPETNDPSVDQPQGNVRER